MDNTNDERQESFVASLDQFFTSIEPVLKEANSVEAAEDLLTNLETTDENFHRYDFVRKLRARIDEMIGPLIDMKLDSLSGDSGSNALLSQIADEIQTSQEFISLQQSVLTDTKEAVNTLVQKYGNPLQRGASDNEFSDPKASRTHPLKDSLDLSDEESLSSSIGQVGYMFMSQEKSGKIAENLHPLKPVQLKIEALSSLTQVPQSDIITSEHWPAIRKGLLAALADDDDHLSEKSLKFHARMFLCSTSHATREIYTCLAEHVWHCFNSKSDMIGVIEHGINVQTKNNARLLKRFRLLNEFQHEVPSYWTRYSERFLEEILESTFTLIDASDCQSSSSSVDQLITPIHYLSLLDPMASWFKKWMHGNYSRTEVVKQLKEHPRLLSDAVAAILDFPHTLKTAVTIPEILEDQDQQEREESGSEEGLFYSARDLEFLFFVHSLCLVGRMFIYNDGRDLFPIELPDRQETLTVTDLLVVFIKIMCIPMPKSMAKAGLDGTIVPEDLVSNVLQEIASSSEAIRECLCKDAITSSLLAPVQNILDGFMDLDSNEESDTESVLLLISDVVAALASSENGRLQLLYGESQERWQRSRLSPAHIIAGFSKKALSDSLCVSLSNDVMGGFLFICRQLWTTSEGLMVLNPYALHEKVANAWKTANELHISPPIDDEDDEEDQEMIQNTDNLVWETSLLDNLLNFAGTPKGVLLLQQTGMMDKCVGYMYERYTKKLQVSKCEKFGYGVMVCQFAATAPGIVQLEKKGYLQRLIQDVWLVFEGLHNRRLQPIIKHIDTIDSRTYIKALNNLLGVFSAFPAVYEILTVPDRPSTSTSEVEEIKPVEDHGLGAPQTLAEFFDRLVIIDNDNKISSLFNYEQTHHFGLRILNVLCSCLDTFLFLESTYCFTDLLLQAQLDNRLDNGKDYIIDRCSIERNQILVKSYWVGGPSERILPGRTLTEDPNNPYPWPLFSCFPPPKDYVVQDHAVITNAFEEGDSILEFLEGEKPTGVESIEWLEKFRETFCTTIKNGTFKCKTKVLKLLLESVCHALTNIPEESIFPLIEFSVGELSLKNTDLSSIETLGVKLAIRYGLQLKILQSSRDATDDLHHLLKYAKFFMRSQQKVQDSTLRTLSVEYPGHDWFVSTIFLMFGGDPEESREFLFKFSSLVCSGYLWIRRLHASVHLPASLTVSGIPPLYSCTCHNIELILQAEVPLVFSAFRMSGYTPSQICQHWLRQCFWNYLPWDHICLYICVCLTLGIDYQVYFCIAIFKHLQQEILKSTQEQTLLVMLKEEPIRNFRLGDHLDFMLHLEKRYRLTILSDLQNITRP